MDPYIEAMGGWWDFHNRFMAECSGLLNDQLPGNYAATLEERIDLFEQPDAPPIRRVPDINLTRDPSATGATSAATVGTATLEPVTVPAPRYEEQSDWFINIVRLPGRELVTTIELLSPSNKKGNDRLSYLWKRQKLLEQNVNVVDIDLLTAGERVVKSSAAPRGDYYVFIARPERSETVDVYAWSIRQPLPRIPIPLRPPDADVFLDLAAAFELTYRRGRYGSLLPYDHDLACVQLSEDDRGWAKSLSPRRG